MSLLDLLCEGETIASLLVKTSITGGREQLAATDSMIIHVKGSKYLDVYYPFIVSIGERRLVRWKWLKTGLVFLALSILLFGTGMLAPGISGSMAGPLNDYTNSLTSGMYSSIMPESLMSVPGAGNTIDDSLKVLFPALDFRGPLLSAGKNVEQCASTLGALMIALAAVYIMAFALTARAGIVVATTSAQYTFYFNNEPKEKRRKFVTAIRSASRDRRNTFN
jgi:hypothetical protein